MPSLNIKYKIIIQHFCLETWALGNQVIVPRKPKSENVKKYRALHDVLFKDPELLPPLPEEDLNRSQFAEKYLKSLLNEKYKNLTYSKRNPKVLIHSKYYSQVKKRFEATGHIASFDDFLVAFK